MPGEALDHDAQLLLLTLRPLADTATADEFSDRVSTAIEKHFPYLERSFDSEEAIRKRRARECFGKCPSRLSGASGLHCTINTN